LDSDDCNTDEATDPGSESEDEDEDGGGHDGDDDDDDEGIYENKGEDEDMENDSGNDNDDDDDGAGSNGAPKAFKLNSVVGSNNSDLSDPPGSDSDSAEFEDVPGTQRPEPAQQAPEPAQPTPKIKGVNIKLQ
jgi:hypothetical protein